MTATSKTEMEKVVRRVLGEEQGDTETSLKAIQRLSRLLTEQIIPKLAEGTCEEALDTGRRRSDGASDPGDAEEASAEDTPDGGADEPEVVPTTALSALGELYRELSEKQATALASFFAALVGDPDDDHEARGALGLSSGRVAGPRARGINVQPGVRIGPTGKLVARILEFYPKKNEIYITAAYRPGRVVIITGD